MSDIKKALDEIEAYSIRTAMRSDSLANAIAEISHITSAATKLTEVGLGSEFMGLMTDIDFTGKLHADALLRTSLGPTFDLKNLLAIEPITLPRLNLPNFELPNSELARLMTSMDALNATYRLPIMTEWKGLAAEALRVSSFAIDTSLTSSIERAMEQMRTPWLDQAHAVESLRGFADLQVLGDSLDRLPPFADSLSEQLRAALGDWRNATLEIPRVEGGIEARTEFYAERGLDFALTGFPAPAFDQSTSIARIQSSPPALLAIYDYEIGARDDEEAAGFERTNAAHDRLQRFEARVRAFIEARMSESFGSNWIRQRVPPDVRDEWIHKAERAARSGDISRPVICYADFTDYEKIICKKENWREVFATIFVRPESVRESFQRLYPVRLATMHARLITQDDQILLYIETKRLLKAMGVL